MRKADLFPEIGPSKTSELKVIAKKRPAALEQTLYSGGVGRFAGVDEVGRGPLAGPVVACACVLPRGFCLPGVKDSKLLKENEIDRLYHELLATSGIDYAVSIVDPVVIDRLNILQATLLAMRQAVRGLKQPPEMLLVDGNKSPPCEIPCITVVKGDTHCLSVSAASIIAKYTRDQLMRAFDATWPQYGFASHKGYGTPLHLERLQQHGPCPIHRRSFRPVLDLYAPKEGELF